MCARLCKPFGSRACTAPGRPGRGTLGAPLGEKLHGAVEGKALYGLSAAQARVRLAVRDILAEPPFLEDDWTPSGGIGAELAKRRFSGTSCAPPFRLNEQRHRLLRSDREQLFLPLQRPGFLTFLDERPKA